MSFDVYSAIGNEVRAKLILCLAKKPKNVSELVNNCGLSQSAVSQHLAKLKKAGLVVSAKTGQTVWYSLKFPDLIKISRLIMTLATKIN